MLSRPVATSPPCSWFKVVLSSAMMSWARVEGVVGKFNVVRFNPRLGAIQEAQGAPQQQQHEIGPAAGLGLHPSVGVVRRFGQDLSHFYRAIVMSLGLLIQHRAPPARLRVRPE